MPGHAQPRRAVPSPVLLAAPASPTVRRPANAIPCRAVTCLPRRAYRTMPHHAAPGQATCLPRLPRRAKTRRARPRLALPAPTMPRLPYHALPSLASPRRAPPVRATPCHAIQACLACRAKPRGMNQIRTRKRPNSPPFSGLHSPTPIPKPARSIKFTMSLGCNRSASYSMLRSTLHSSN